MLSSYRVAEHLARQGFTFYRHNDFGRDAESMDRPISAGEAVSNLRQKSFDRHASWEVADIRISVPDGCEPIPVMNEPHLTALDQLYSQEPLSPPTADQQKLRRLREMGCKFDSEGEVVPLGQLYWRMAGAHRPGCYLDGERRSNLYCADELKTSPRPESAALVRQPATFNSLHRLVEYLDAQPGPHELQAGLEHGFERLRLRNTPVLKTLALAAANPLGSLDVLRALEPVWAKKPEFLWSTAVGVLPTEGAIQSGFELLLPAPTPAGQALRSLAAELENPAARAALPELIRAAFEHPQASPDRLLGYLYLRAREASRLDALDPLLTELQKDRGWELPQAYQQALAFRQTHPEVELDPRHFLAPGASFNPLQVLSGAILDQPPVLPELKLDIEEDTVTIGDQVLFLEPLQE
ncbi:MAG: hypothetical protein AB7S38_13395 [Vulcanimicrobiota bacterium]